MKALYSAILIVFVVHNTCAQTSGFGVYYDEDHEAPFNEDRNYTLGLGLVYSNFAFASILNPKWLKLSKADKDNSIFFNPSVALIGAGFTPDSLYKTTVIYGDRPYASFLGLRLGTSFLNLKKDLYEEDLLIIGVLGLNLAKNIQTFIHCHDGNCDYEPPFRPRGWHNQISNGGEFTFLYGKTQEWLITRKNVNDANNINRSLFDFKAGYNVHVGYYTDVYSAFTFRFGFLDPRNWIRNTLFLGQVGGLEPNPAKRKLQYFNEKRKKEFYIFGNAKPGVILWNSMLLGQFKKNPDPYPITYKDMRKVVIMGNLGLACFIPFKKSLSGVDLQYSVNFKTSEVSTAYKRTHFWGTISANFAFQK